MTHQTPGRGVADVETPREERPGPGRTWTIRVPACEWLTDNDRRRPIAVAGIVRDWRQAVVAACQQAQLPLNVSPVTIHAVLWWVGRRAPVNDSANLARTVKAIVDGLVPARDWVRGAKRGRTVGYGLIPDDSDRHVKATMWELRKSPLQWTAWVDLTVTEVPDGV